MNDVSRLATYNSERHRGLMHTEQYQQEMANLQAEYDVLPLPGNERAEPCRLSGQHSRFTYHRRRGPFWARRDQYTCMRCNTVVGAP